MADVKQQERRQRGEEFQDELRRSWRYIPKCWRMRITDHNSGTRPADEIVLLPSINILAEAKRTNGDRFTLSMVRPNQQKGLYDFDVIIPRHRGLIFISFLNDTEDVAYAFRFIDALQFMRNTGVNYIPLTDFKNGVFKCVELPLLHDTDNNRYYDLKGVERCYR